MADPWEQAAKEYGGQAASTTASAKPAASEDWKLWQAKETVPQSKGFAGELWDEVKNGPANLLRTGNAINQAIAHPIDTLGAMGDQIAGTAKKAKEAFQSGNYIKAGREALNTGINAVAPGMGTSSSQAGEMYDRGDYAGATGKTLGIGVNAALTAKTPQIMQKTAELPTTISNLNKVDPRIAINRSLRPTPSDPNFSAKVPETLAAIQETNGGGTPATIQNGRLGLVDAANKRIQFNEQALRPWIDRAKGIRISAHPIIDATKAATAEMLPSEQTAGAGLVQRAMQDYGAGFTPEQALERLRLLNQRLSPFYSKSPRAQSSVLADIPDSVLIAQRDALADTLYKALDPEGGGMSPRSIQSQTGNVIDVRDAALRRQNAIVAEQPLTPLGKVIDPLKGAIRAVLPGKATGAGIAYAEGSEGRSLPLIRRAFKSVKGQPVNALPKPPSELYPTGDTTRLLGQGDIITPPPADTSGVRSAPAMAQPPNPSRALGPGGASPIITPPPADTSGMKVTTGPPLQAPTSRQLPPGPSVRTPSDLSGPSGDITDLVPIKNPVTGRIEYIPRPQNPQNIPQYAKGGIIHNPTLLSDLKTGKPTGIMAEEGPEAIMPIGHKIGGALAHYIHEKRTNPLGMAIGHIGAPRLAPPKYRNQRGIK